MAGERYNVVSPQGVAGTVPAEQWADFAAKGYRPDTLEDFRKRQLRKIASEETGKAFGVGAASGATFGVSNLAARYAAEDPEAYAEYLAALREANPVATTAGEVGGAVASSVLLPAVSPAGIVGKLGATAERGVAAAITRGGAEGVGRAIARTAISKGAGSAVEGAFYGAGQLLTESALGDEELTAENLISHVGMGAILGGAFTGAVGAVGGLAKAGIQRGASAAKSRLGEAIKGDLGEKLEKKALEFADESALKVTGARGSDIRRLGTEAKVEQVGGDLRKHYLKDGRKLIEMGDDSKAFLEKARIAREEAGEELGKMRKSADEYLAESKGKFKIDVGDYLGRVKKEVLDPLGESMVPSEQAKAAGVLNQMSLLQKRVDEGHEFTFAELTKVRQGFAKDVYGETPKGVGLPPLPSPHAAQLQKAERMLDEFITENMEKVSTAGGKENLAEKYVRAKRLDESIIKATSLAEKAGMQDIGNRWLSPTDYLTGIGAGVGGMMTGGLGGALAGGAVALAHRTIRERGRSVASGLAEKFASLVAAERANQVVSKKIDAGLRRFFQASAPVTEVASKAVAPASAQLMQGLRKSVGLGPGDRESRGSPGRMQERRMNRKVNDFHRTLDKYEEIVRDPARSTEKMAKITYGLSAGAPNTAAHLQTKLVGGAQFLLSKAPRPPIRTASLNPLLEKWEPTEMELSKWRRYVAAVENPMSVVEDLETGQITHEGVEALKAVYPRLYAGVVDQTMKLVMDLGEKIPYERRLALGIMLDAPTDPSLDPLTIQGLQGVYSTPMPEDQAMGQQPERPVRRGSGTFALSKAATTKTERIAAR